jgi:hypothetical protein
LSKRLEMGFVKEKKRRTTTIEKVVGSRRG